jgi:voltage-gated potassium channel Kch
VPVYRITEPGIGRLHVQAWRHRALCTLGVLLLTLLSSMLALALLDPSAEPPSQKAFRALWNAGNLISTLGDFTPFTDQQKGFVIVAMFTLVILGGYAVTTLTGILASDAVMAYRENRSMERILDRLTNHIVVVGFGAIGRLVAGQLKDAGTRVLVVDRDAIRAAQASELGHLVVQGEAGVERGVLDRAGIEHAKALVVTTEDPDRKVAIALMAHTLCPDLRIVVTGRNDPRGALLQRAGASEVVVVDDLVAGALIDRLGRNTGT